MTLIQTLINRLPEEMDAALITGANSRRYLTGFSSSAGTLVLTRKSRTFIVDSRYFEGAKQAIRDCEVLLQDKLYEQIRELLRGSGVRTVAVESDVCTVRELVEYRERLPGFALLEDSRLSEKLGELRRVKTPEELARMRRVQSIADAVFTHLLDYIKPGLTERDIALEIEFYGRGLGADGLSFAPIVASGENSAKPHCDPTDRVVGKGDFLTMDFGYVLDGYCSDMTRTVAIGSVTHRQRRVYETVLAAQQAAFAAIGPGVVCKEVDRAARELIDASPFAGTFGHGLGHSLGLEVHERPAFNTRDETVLEPGMCLSVEPGIYLPGEFGVRIEDVICCTDTGFENFMSSPKELMVL